MTKILFFISSLFLILNFNILCFAKDIVYIDLEKIIKESEPGSSLIRKFKDLNRINLEKFKDAELDFKNKEKKLLVQKNIISEKDFKSKVNVLRSEINAYNKNKEKTINNLNKIRLNSTESLLKSINPILGRYSKENDILLILQKKFLVIGKSELDITDEIMILVNKEIKKIEIN